MITRKQLHKIVHGAPWVGAPLILVSMLLSSFPLFLFANVLLFYCWFLFMGLIVGSIVALLELVTRSGESVWRWING